MAQGLSKAVFDVGPDEELLVVDAYEEKGDKVLNQISKRTSDSAANAAQQMVPKKGSPPKPTGSTQGLKETADSVKDYLKSAAPTAASSLNGLPTEINDIMAKPMGVTNVLATVNNVTSSIKDYTAQTVKKVGNLLTSAAGVPNNVLSIVDQNNMASAGANAVLAATKVGIPNAYSIMAGSMSNAPNALRNMTKQILPTVATTAAVGLLENVADGPVAKEVKSMMPTLIPQFVRNYKNAEGIAARALPQVANRILTSFNKIDPQWEEIPQGQKTTPLIESSEDFKQLVKSVSQQHTVAIVGDPVSIDTSAIEDETQLTCTLATAAFDLPADQTNTQAQLFKDFEGVYGQ